MEQNFFNIDERIKSAAKKAEENCKEMFSYIDEVREYNQLKVLSAFIKNGISESHFVGSTGYGYGDRGRDVLDTLYADVFGCEDALVRHNFVSGTHALTVALFGVLRPNDIMLSVTGKPYDTLEEVIGLNGVTGTGSLIDFGVKYDQVDLLEDGSADIEMIKQKAVTAKMIYIQRSRGYSLRPSLTVEQIGVIANAAKSVNKDAIVVVDNCYGEFAETTEPTQHSADLIIGSLIKNPGGGISDTGGYIAGRKDLVELCAFRLTSPGMGKEVGCTLDQTKKMIMGLFFAPNVVAEAIKTAVFAAALFESFGFEVIPKYHEKRADIIQSVKLLNSENLIAFCQGIQKGAPVDSFVVPEPWDMPGYNSQVIMAAGAFTMGASIELSADAPLREPYAAWLQGGLTYYSAKMGVMLAAQSMLDKGLLKI